MEIKFVPLSFINSHEEILKQIKNTVLIAHLFDLYKETTLEYYLESTQYGYTASALESGKHKLVRITDINDGNVNWDSVPFCDCNVEDKYLLKDQDILVARTGGTTGKSFIVNNPPKNAVFASYLIRLRLNDKVDIDFITYFLNSYAFWSQIIEMKSGSAMPNVNAEKLKTLKLPKCDLRIQKEIISVFNNSKKINGFQFLFDKVSSIKQLFFDNKSLSTELTHQLTLVKKLRQQLLQDAVQGKLVEQNPNDEPAGELLKRIKAEKVKLIAEKKLKKEKEILPIKVEEIPFEIPENWTWCRLGEIVNLVTSGSRDWAKYYSAIGDIFIRMGNLSRGNFNLRMDKIQYVNPPQNQEGNRTRLEEGDILVSITGEVGNLGLIPKDFGDAYINQHTALVRLNKTIVTKFICHLFLSDAMQQQFNAPQRGMKNSFRLSDIDYLLIPLPPLSEQHRIVQKLEGLMQTCNELEESIKQSASQNEKLLQQVLREALRKEVV